MTKKTKKVPKSTNRLTISDDLQIEILAGMRDRVVAEYWVAFVLSDNSFAVACMVHAEGFTAPRAIAVWNTPDLDITKHAGFRARFESYVAPCPVGMFFSLNDVAARMSLWPEGGIGVVDNGESTIICPAAAFGHNYVCDIIGRATALIESIGGGKPTKPYD